MLTKERNLTECYKEVTKLTEEINTSDDKNKVKILRLKRRKLLRNRPQKLSLRDRFKGIK